MEESKRLPK
jgi:hypothetical protein